MSQQKAQLISPIDTFTPPGINVTGAGIVTATSFVGSGGTVTGLAAGANVTAGVVTATSFYGDGSNLDGVAAAGYVGQTTAAQSGTTTIDLSAGNVIYFTQDTDTTVAFASTEAVQELLFIRTKDDTTTARTITWPDSIIWNGGSAPTLIDSNSSDDVQIFNLTTRDQGVTWYGYEAMKNDPAEPIGLYSWGYSSNGMLGINDATDNRSSPIQIPGTTWNNTDGGAVALATKTDGTLWAWGNDYGGRLGQNAPRLNQSSPIQIPGTQWNLVTAGSSTQFATKTDGTLWSWGSNSSYGMLGLNDKVDYSSPVQIPGTWTAIDAGSGSSNAGHSLGLQTNDLYAWGSNNGGQLGQNQGSIYRSRPVQIPGTWSKIRAGGDTGGESCSFAINSSNQLYGWGRNSSGRLGQNNQVSYSSPKQIPGNTWASVATSSQQTIATKTDGTLWAWGSGGTGELAQNNRTSYSSPKQIPGTSWSTDQNQINGNRYGLFCMKTDGTLWAWGGYYGGRLGQNSEVHYSSPVQIPGTWYTITGRINTFYGRKN